MYSTWWLDGWKVKENWKWMQCIRPMTLYIPNYICDQNIQTTFPRYLCYIIFTLCLTVYFSTNIVLLDCRHLGHQMWDVLVSSVCKVVNYANLKIFSLIHVTNVMVIFFKRHNNLHKNPEFDLTKGFFHFIITSLFDCD